MAQAGPSAPHRGDYDGEPAKRVANRRNRCQRERLRDPPELTAAKTCLRRSAPARVVANAIFGSKPYRGDAVSMMVCDCMPSSVSLPDVRDAPVRFARSGATLQWLRIGLHSVARTVHRVCRLRIAESASVVTWAGTGCEAKFAGSSRVAWSLARDQAPSDGHREGVGVLPSFACARETRSRVSAPIATGRRSTRTRQRA